ncbi:MAG: hypothetical protein HY554_18125 [Elusimicrobia bacterium]|nr:hypothetical protein [Elusimicrobiota bacterium]
MRYPRVVAAILLSGCLLPRLARGAMGPVPLEDGRATEKVRELAEMISTRDAYRSCDPWMSLPGERVDAAFLGAAAYVVTCRKREHSRHREEPDVVIFREADLTDSFRVHRLGERWCLLYKPLIPGSFDSQEDLKAAIVETGEISQAIRLLHGRLRRDEEARERARRQEGLRSDLQSLRETLALEAAGPKDDPQALTDLYDGSRGSPQDLELEPMSVRAAGRCCAAPLAAPRAASARLDVPLRVAGQSAKHPVPPVLAGAAKAVSRGAALAWDGVKAFARAFVQVAYDQPIMPVGGMALGMIAASAFALVAGMGAGTATGGVLAALGVLALGAAAGAAFWTLVGTILDGPRLGR